MTSFYRAPVRIRPNADCVFARRLLRRRFGVSLSVVVAGRFAESRRRDTPPQRDVLRPQRRGLVFQLRRTASRRVDGALQLPDGSPQLVLLRLQFGAGRRPIFRVRSRPFQFADQSPVFALQLLRRSLETLRPSRQSPVLQLEQRRSRLRAAIGGVLESGRQSASVSEDVDAARVVRARDAVRDVSQFGGSFVRFCGFTCSGTVTVSVAQ